MTDEKLKEIEDRVQSGVQWTPEECEIKPRADGYIFVPECATLGDTIIQLGGHYEDYQADWVFAAHSRQDVRVLIDEVKRLRGLK